MHTPFNLAPFSLTIIIIIIITFGFISLQSIYII